MASLYQLTDEYMQLLNMMDERDMDADIIRDTMEGIEGELEIKADGYAKVMKQLESDANGLKTEEARLHERRQTIENNIKRMKAALQMMMESTGKVKFKTELFSFGIQNNPESVVLDEQYIENIPEEYIKYADPTVDKAKIKEDLKAGKNLEGIAHLEQTRGLRIR